MDDPSTLSATELTAALRRREISSRELLAHFLQRIEQDAGTVNAVVTLDEERAVEQAGAADESLFRGGPLGPLVGLPMTVKDSIETGGLRTTCGARELAGHIPDRDADAVARLRDAGAIVFGKTNVPVFATDYQSFNPLFGTTNNPWDVSRTPGGSAGGAAAALAAGHTGFEIGSDLAGSIRIPAAFCGVYGLRPSHGVIPTRGHIPGWPGDLAPADMATIGPMGRSADDLDLGLDVLAGPDANTAIGWRLQLPGPRAGSLAGYRIAVWIDDPYCAVDSEVVDALKAGLDAMRAAGARIDEAVVPVPLAESDQLFQQVLAGVVAGFQPVSMIDQLQALAAAADPGDLSPRIQWARWVTQPVSQWHQARERRARLAARWAGFFRDYDVLLCPVSFTAAPAHDHTPDPGARFIVVNGTPRPYLTQSTWSGVAAVADLPAATAPIGLTSGGLPVGIQIIAPYLHDRTAVDVARQFERVLGRLPLPSAA